MSTYVAFKAPTMNVGGKTVEFPIPIQGCNKDADCWVANANVEGMATAKTSDEEKGKICCAYMGFEKLPATVET